MTSNDSSTLQAQAFALGNPTRNAIFRFLVEAQRPVGVAELTEQWDLNHTAIRQHLARLVESGLVLESTARPKGRGRPPLQYEVNLAADGRWGTTSPYERLSVLLTEVVASGSSPREVGRKAGRRQVEERIAAGSPSTDLVAEMRREGFEPDVSQDGDEVVVTLRACPFESAVGVDSDTVCQLHLGLAEGMAEATNGWTVHDLTPHDPKREGCRLTCRVNAEAPATPVTVDRSGN